MEPPNDCMSIFELTSGIRRSKSKDLPIHLEVISRKIQRTGFSEKRIDVRNVTRERSVMKGGAKDCGAVIVHYTPRFKPFPSISVAYYGSDLSLLRRHFQPLIYHFKPDGRDNILYSTDLQT